MLNYRVLISAQRVFVILFNGAALGFCVFGLQSAEVVPWLFI